MSKLTLSKKEESKNRMVLGKSILISDKSVKDIIIALHNKYKK